MSSLSLTVLIGLHVDLGALSDSLAVAQQHADAEVGEGREVVDGVLAAVCRLLSALLFTSSFGAVLNRQAGVVAAGHIVAQRLPAKRHLTSLDVHHLQLPRAVHGL